MTIASTLPGTLSPCAPLYSTMIGGKLHKVWRNVATRRTVAIPA